MFASVRFFRMAALVLALTIGATVSAFSQRFIEASESSVDFGNVAVGASTMHTITLTNVSNGPVTILGHTIYGLQDEFDAKFNANIPLTLAAGQSVALIGNFSPKSNGTKQTSMAIFNNSVDSATFITLVGTGGFQAPRMTVSPQSLNFGDVRINTTTTLTVTVTNTASVAQSIMWVQIPRNNNTSIFSVVNGNTFPVQVAANSTYTISVACTPTDLGDMKDFLFVAQGGSGFLTVDSLELSCTGVQRIKNSNGGSELVISKPKDQKGDVNVGTNNTLSFNVVNNGQEDMVITSAMMGGKDKSVFSVSNTFPFVVKPGTTEKLNVVCKPNVAGELKATVTIDVKDAGSADIPVSAMASGVSSTEDGAVAAFSMYPNPATNLVRIVLPENSSRVEILSASGTVVKSFDARNATSLEWHCNNASGNRVANGVYFVHIQTAQGMTTSAVVLQD